MFNHTTSDYNLLYARWLEKPETLLNLGSYRHGQRLLDLCGGTGIVTRTALEKFKGLKKADVTVFDLNPRVGDWANPYKLTDELQIVTGKAEEVNEYFINSFEEMRFEFHNISTEGMGTTNFPSHSRI